MPNWCYNELRVSGRRALLEEFIERVKSDKVEFDFESVIPYPEEFRRADEAHEAWGTENAHIPWGERPPRPLDGYNQGGYDWCIQRWGTKWNSSGAVIDRRDRSVLISFQTAWSPPIPVIDALSRLFPELSLKLNYWEQGAGYKGVHHVKESLVLEQWEGSYKGNRGG